MLTVALLALRLTPTLKRALVHHLMGTLVLALPLALVLALVVPPALLVLVLAPNLLALAQEKKPTLVGLMLVLMPTLGLGLMLKRAALHLRVLRLLPLELTVLRMVARLLKLTLLV